MPVLPRQHNDRQEGRQLRGLFRRCCSSIRVGALPSSHKPCHRVLWRGHCELSLRVAAGASCAAALAASTGAACAHVATAGTAAGTGNAACAHVAAAATAAGAANTAAPYT
jgi:hypothetical protein